MTPGQNALPAFYTKILRPVLLVCLLLSAWMNIASAAEPQFPQLTGRIVDNAGLLNDADKAGITADLEALEAKSGDQLVVVTLKSLQGFEIEEFGYKLGRHWGIGQSGSDNGVLLIVAPKERKVRIEVGRKLEGQLTDAFSKLIIENSILPRFRSGDFPGGIKAGVSGIIAVITSDGEQMTLRGKVPETRPAKLFEAFTVFFILTIWVIIIFAVAWTIIRAVNQGSSSSSGRKSSGGAAWGTGRSSGGGWSSGGGGFSGGGGSFGGGGSSGSW